MRAAGERIAQAEGKPLYRHGLVYDGLPLVVASTRLAAELVPAQLAMALDSRGTAHILYTAPADAYLSYCPATIIRSRTRFAM